MISRREKINTAKKKTDVEGMLGLLHHALSSLSIDVYNNNPGAARAFIKGKSSFSAKVSKQLDCMFLRVTIDLPILLAGNERGCR